MSCHEKGLLAVLVLVQSGLDGLVPTSGNCIKQVVLSSFTFYYFIGFTIRLLRGEP